MKAGIVLKSKFYKSDNVDNYSGLIDYIDRKSARNSKKVIEKEMWNKKNEKERAFLENPYRTNGIFSASKDYFSSKEKIKIKEEFDNAQKKGSLLWSQVLTFDNEFLEQNGLMLNGQLLEEKFVESARNCMNVLMEKENLNGMWVAGIHYDKEHIHLHFAITESESTRLKIDKGLYKGELRGKFTQSTLNSIKSTCLNTLVNYSKYNECINEIIRERIVHDFILNKKNRQIRKKINELVNILEEECPQTYKWVYNRNDMKQYHELIHDIIDEFIDTYHKKEFDNLISLLNKQNKLYTEAYGISKQNSDFKINKLNELNSSLGNKILKECREISKIRRKENQYDNSQINLYKNNKKVSYKNNTYDITKFNYHINLLLKDLANEFLHKKNQMVYEYQQFLNELEREGYNLDL